MAHGNCRFQLYYTGPAPAAREREPNTTDWVVRDHQHDRSVNAPVVARCPDSNWANRVCDALNAVEISNLTGVHPGA